jgi:16S rRNA (cytosine1402-N4)-methyltransferase
MINKQENGSSQLTNNDEQTTVHKPVLLNEVLANLAPRENGVYVDATFGRGGHTAALLPRVKHLYAFDRDPTAAEYAREHFSGFKNFTFINRPFSELLEGLAEHAVHGIDGILMDLGVSSPQLDVAERGFSFRQDGPLDMRMDFTRGQPVSEWLAEAGHQEIARVLRTLGDESDALAIASEILNTRTHTALTRTSQLADIVTRVKRKQGSSKSGNRKNRSTKVPIHPATKTFQALRIFINRELQELESCLEQSLEVLNTEGRVCVISFHSLEDRIVKRFMRNQSRVDPGLSTLPEIPVDMRPKLKVVGKAIRATKDELAINPRARSAVMRVAERLQTAA